MSAALLARYYVKTSTVTVLKENIQTHLLLVVQSNKELARKNEEFVSQKNGMNCLARLTQLTKKVEAMKKKGCMENPERRIRSVLTAN